MKKSSTFEEKKRKPFDNLIDMMLFGRDVRQLVEIINSDIAHPETASIRPVSHPAGFSRLITGRRLTIAEAYMRLLSYSANTGYVERIEALQTLMHFIRFSEKVSMPINTARVQIALMKNAVKMHGDRQAQLELMSDFSTASNGKENVIRRLLKELNLIEVSETPGSFTDQILAWDDHVHEPPTEKHHSPSLLVLSAFIKGMSKITVSYYDMSNKQRMEEIFLASELLGIHSQIGIRFSVGKNGARRSYLFIPSHEWTASSFWNFWDERREMLTPFFEGLKVNAQRRSDVIHQLIQVFNDTVVPNFNKGYENAEALCLKPLSWDAIERTTRHGQINRKHLGLVIFRAIHPVMLKRVLFLKNKYLIQDPESEQARINYKKYKEYKSKYESLTPSLCSEWYIQQENERDYDSYFQNESDILPLLCKAGGYVAYIRTLSNGLNTAIDTILDNYHNITDVEVYNMVDAERYGLEAYTQFTYFIQMLHEGNTKAVTQIIQQNHATQRSEDEIAQACTFIQNRPFYTRCASDSYGWSSKIPGMGFFHEFQLETKAFSLIRQSSHTALPQPIAEVLWAHRPQNTNKKRVFLLSAMEQKGEWIDGDIVQTHELTPSRFWRYLNVDARCMTALLLGLIPTYLWLGIWYAIIWFVLTAFRNAIVDLIAAAGVGPKHWKLKSIDRENMCISLFFSGLSVPVLAAAKVGFDMLWLDTLGWDDGGLFTFCKFWVISLANGIYLVLHNKLRGFDKSVIYANFFRSILSWPLATVGSYVLTPLGVPDVVQSKIASEIVAGFIEGSVKFRKKIRLSRKALFDIYKQLLSTNALNALLARLDILFFWSRKTLGRRALEKFFREPEKIPHIRPEEISTIRQGNACIVHTLEEEKSLENLTNAILEYYPEEDLEVLTDLAGETYRPFEAWVKSLPKPSSRQNH